MRFWSPVAAPAGPDARRHQVHLVTDDLAQAGRLFRRADEPVDAEHLRLLRARFDQIGDVEAIARGMQIAVVIGGQHGDGENFQARSGARLDRGLHGLRIGVHGEEGRAEFGDALDAARHRVADVVQLEIDENLLAGFRQLLRQRQAAGISRADSRSCRSSRCRRAAQSSLPPRPRRADRAPRSGGPSARYRLAACHLTSCVGKCRSTAAPALSAPRLSAEFFSRSISS